MHSVPRCRLPWLFALTYIVSCSNGPTLDGTGTITATLVDGSLPAFVDICLDYLPMNAGTCVPANIIDLQYYYQDFVNSRQRDCAGNATCLAKNPITVRPGDIWDAIDGRNG